MVRALDTIFDEFITSTLTKETIFVNQLYAWFIPCLRADLGSLAALSNAFRRQYQGNGSTLPDGQTVRFDKILQGYGFVFPYHLHDLINSLPKTALGNGSGKEKESSTSLK